MSKRLQVLLPEEEYQELSKVAKSQNKTISEFVRERIKESLQIVSRGGSEGRLAKVLSYAKYQGPTGEIEDILKSIEKGRGL